MKYLCCVRSDKGPFTDRCVVTTDYMEFLQKASTMTKKYMKPLRARACHYLIQDMKEGGTHRIGACLLSAEPEEDDA